MNNNFFCPGCKKHDALMIKLSVEIPEHTVFDDVDIQSIRCNNCKKSGMGIYEESRRGNLQDETVNHYGYWLDTESQLNLDQLLESCQNDKEKEGSNLKLSKFYKDNFANSKIRLDLSTQFNIEI